MQKIVIHKPGGYDRLRLESHPDPVPGPGEALLRISAIGVNYADVTVRWGLYASAREYVGWPITPGFEWAGEVLDLGEGSTGFERGQEVFGVSLFNGYASHICARTQQIFPRPAAFSPEEAAGFPAVFLTAYHALFQMFVIRKGMKILVHSAAGGVGTALLQLGRIAGCEMTGVVGQSHKVEVARHFGAAHVIDKSQEDLWKRAEAIAPGGYDVVLDANGVSTLKQSFAHLRPTGKLISYGFASMLPKRGGKLNRIKLGWDWLRTPRFSPFAMTNRSVLSFNLSFLFDHTHLLKEAMRDLLSWVEEGRIRPPRVKTFPLAEAAAAHKFLESGQSTGKLILIPGPDPAPRSGTAGAGCGTVSPASECPGCSGNVPGAGAPEDNVAGSDPTLHG